MAYMAGLRIRSVVRWGLITISFLFFILVALALVVASAAALLYESKRRAADRRIDNLKTLYIGIAYVLLAVVSLVYFAVRRRDVQRKLGGIPRMHIATRQGDVPKSVHKYIANEYLRSAAILYASQPANGHQDGWGDPGTEYAGVRFRRAILDSVVQVDEAARTIVPRLQPIRPHARVLHHLRALAPLIPVDESGGSCLRRYDAIVEFAKYGKREMALEEYVEGIKAAEEVVRVSYVPCVSR
ncbi:hypothetical protein EXIGLDRAFT_419726 [Exidia glandulosa HHB12029]|uniref:Defect at low temperature protein 1 n=1 Tax=Exidia glandulosa HHB12029 TaxID=1314781 RepID=A0A165PV72_EXIGL|nr:hypothetical protein EXIGLDRAFT_419726 [Exidia glandulosa HHB12029]